MAWMEEQTGVSLDDACKWACKAVREDNLERLKGAVELHPSLAGWRVKKGRGSDWGRDNVDSLLILACSHLSLNCAQWLLNEKPLGAIKRAHRKQQEAQTESDADPTGNPSQATLEQQKARARRAHQEQEEWTSLLVELEAAFDAIEHNIPWKHKRLFAAQEERSILALARSLGKAIDSLEESQPDPLSTTLRMMGIAGMVTSSERLAQWFWERREKTYRHHKEAQRWSVAAAAALCQLCAASTPEGFNFVLARLPANAWRLESAQTSTRPLEGGRSTDPEQANWRPPFVSLETALWNCLSNAALDETRSIEQLEALQGTGAQWNAPRAWFLNAFKQAPQKTLLQQWMQKSWAMEERETLSQTLSSKEPLLLERGPCDEERTLSCVEPSSEQGDEAGQRKHNGGAPKRL